MTATQLAVDEEMIHLHGRGCCLYGATHPRTNKTPDVSLYLTTMKQATRLLLDELHCQYQLDDVLFPVDSSDSIGPHFDGDRYRLQTV